MIMTDKYFRAIGVLKEMKLLCVAALTFREDVLNWWFSFLGRRTITM